jgi:hypothetical protein
MMSFVGSNGVTTSLFCTRVKVCAKLVKCVIAIPAVTSQVPSARQEQDGAAEHTSCEARL